MLLISIEWIFAQTQTQVAVKDSTAMIVDSLWIRAASGDIKFRDLVEPSKKAIIDMGIAAVPEMLTKLNTRDAREMQVVTDIFKGIGEPAADSLVNYVKSDDPFKRRLVIRSLEEIKSPKAINPLLGMAGHQDFRTRAAAISALGSIGQPEAAITVMQALADNNELVATAAAVACGKIKQDINPGILINALCHNYYGVRYSAAKSLSALGEIALPSLIAHLDTFPDDFGAGYVIEALGGTGLPGALTPLERELNSKEWVIRAAAAEALGHIADKKARKILENMLKTETHPLVIAKAKASIAMLDSGNGS